MGFFKTDIKSVRPDIQLHYLPADVMSFNRVQDTFNLNFNYKETDPNQ